MPGEPPVEASQTPAPAGPGSQELFARLATQTAVSLSPITPNPQGGSPTGSPEGEAPATPPAGIEGQAGAEEVEPTGSAPAPQMGADRMGAHRMNLPQILLYRHPLEGTTFWAAPDLPAGMLEGLALPPGLKRVETSDEADLRLAAGPGAEVSRWVYALAAPFPTLQQGVTLEAVVRAWQGAEGEPLLVEAGAREAFSALWGPPAEGAVLVAPAGELLQAAWDNGSSWALVPFEALEPRWTVLAVDGLSPLQQDFDPQAYPLSVPFSLQGEVELVARAVELLGPASQIPLVPPGNREADKMTVLAMTGVTALVRATAHTMEQQGIEYPARDIRDWLSQADLTHISNEVPFARDCPPPNPVQADMRFCSDPRYIGLLEAVGTDVVELTGDHFQDWGAEAMLFTLDLYQERGWLTYGGGANLEQARRAVTVEHNGNRLAFIGCNAKGGGYAQAGENRPGAAACDMDWMVRETARLRSEGYLPIATFQHFEYYTYNAQPDQRRDFRALAEAGAVIVSGSQAHQPQAMEFRPGEAGTAFIHYGLGNLFFDQYDVSQATRQAFIDRHIFYNGRYIGVELLPILFVDYARARPMEAGEREELLRAVFSASGW